MKKLLTGILMLTFAFAANANCYKEVEADVAKVKARDEGALYYDTDMYGRNSVRDFGIVAQAPGAIITSILAPGVGIIFGGALAVTSGVNAILQAQRVKTLNIMTVSQGIDNGSYKSPEDLAQLKAHKQFLKAKRAVEKKLRKIKEDPTLTISNAAFAKVVNGEASKKIGKRKEKNIFCKVKGKKKDFRLRAAGPILYKRLASIFADLDLEALELSVEDRSQDVIQGNEEIENGEGSELEREEETESNEQEENSTSSAA